MLFRSSKIALCPVWTESSLAMTIESLKRPHSVIGMRSFLLFGDRNVTGWKLKCCYTGFSSPDFKESTGFEPARQGKPGSADFESAALPLCQLSGTPIIIT